MSDNTLQSDVEAPIESHDVLLGALTKIAEAPEGAYSKDRVKYLNNVVQWCQETARAAIAKAKGEQT